MNPVKRIIPECDSNTLLVELLLQKDRPHHGKGITEVIKALLKHPTNEIVIGFADTERFTRDKHYPELLEFNEIVENKLETEKIIIYKKPTTNKYLIRIHPAFEKWIWEIAIENGIDPNEYGISSYEELERLSKHYRTNQNPQFKKFVNAVVRKDPSPAPIQTLRQWIVKVFE
jgi:hypothetical protein